MWAIYGWRPKDVDQLSFFQFMRAGIHVQGIVEARKEHGHRTGW